MNESGNRKQLVSKIQYSLMAQTGNIVIVICVICVIIGSVPLCEPVADSRFVSLSAKPRPVSFGAASQKDHFAVPTLSPSSNRHDLDIHRDVFFGKFTPGYHCSNVTKNLQVISI